MACGFIKYPAQLTLKAPVKPFYRKGLSFKRFDWVESGGEISSFPLGAVTPAKLIRFDLITRRRAHQCWTYTRTQLNFVVGRNQVSHTLEAEGQGRRLASEQNPSPGVGQLRRLGGYVCWGYSNLVGQPKRGMGVAPWAGDMDCQCR